MRWQIPKLFKINAGSSLRKRVAYSLAIVRLILIPVIFLAVYYLFQMGRIVDRIVNVDTPAAKLAEQASLDILEARRSVRNYALFRAPEYLQANQESLLRVRQSLLHIADIQPDDKPAVQHALEAVSLYQQRFSAAASGMGKSKQEPVERIREAVLDYEKDLDNLVKAAKHETRDQVIQDLRTRVVSFDARISETIQVGSPAASQITPVLRAASEQTLQLVSHLESRNWARVQSDHEQARRLIHVAEWDLSTVSAIALVFSVFVSFILPRQVVKPLVSLKKAVDHAATGNYEVDFEVQGSGEVAELARSVQNLTSLLRRQS
jgi:CHASE3 domain sensor protein